MILETGAQLVDVGLAFFLVGLHLGVESLLGGDDEVIRLLAADAGRLLDLGHLLSNGGHLTSFQALNETTNTFKFTNGELKTTKKVFIAIRILHYNWQSNFDLVSQDRR